MRHIISLLFITFYLFASDNISELLQKLNDKEELYHKTKVESAGLLILYTRDDLDKMQAYTLKDILRSLRFFTLKEGYVGEDALSPSGGSTVLSSMFRLYIDDHEVSSSIYGSSMLQFAEIDLDFVDHIEIYEGGNAISFGNEPGFVTIRIYTKKPDKERGGTLFIDGDSRGSKSVGTVYANKINQNSSILLYTNAKNNNRKDLIYNSNRYSKDSRKTSFYAKYNLKDRGSLSFGYFAKEKDAFVGTGFSQTPIEPNKIKRRHFFSSLNYNLPQNFKLNISVDKMKHRLLFSDKNKIRTIQHLTPFTYFDGEYDESIYKILLKQKIEYKKSSFQWGVEGVQKDYDIKHMFMDSDSISSIDGPSTLNIASIYAEESYNINENNLLIATLKYDNYDDNYKSSSTEHILRVGYIHLFSHNLSSKLFISQTYIYPGFAYTSTFPNSCKSNPLLKAEHYKTYVGELKYDTFKDSVKLGGAFVESKDNIIVNPTTREFINSSKKIRTLRMFADYAYKFNSLNKITFEFYNTHFLYDDMKKLSPTVGGYIRLLNSYGKYDFFNELIFRNSYTYPYPAVIGGPIDIKNGYDYNFGIKWHVNHAFTLSLKGSNILNKASKSPIYSIGGVNALERKVVCRLEYVY